MENDHNRETSSSSSSSSSPSFPNNGSLRPPPPPPPTPPSSVSVGRQPGPSPQNPPPPPPHQPSLRPRDVQGGTATITTTAAPPPPLTNNSSSHHQNPSTSTNDQTSNALNNIDAIDSSSFANFPIISVRVLSSKNSTSSSSSPPKKRIRNRLLYTTRPVPSPKENETKEGDVVRILLTPNLTESQLESCILQAAASGGAVELSDEDITDYGKTPLQTTTARNRRKRSSSFSTTSLLTPPQTLAGMFRESDNVFIPLSYILSSPRLFQGQIFCLVRQPIVPQKPSAVISLSTTNNHTQRKTSLVTISFMTALISILSAMLFQYYVMTTKEEYMDSDDDTTMLERIHHSLETFDIHHVLFLIRKSLDDFAVFVMNLFVKAMDVMIEIPLRELYRHGPAVIGWEGASLPQICARITYHGDEEFWSKNSEECEKIYRLKEDAALRIHKPILYAILVYFMFLLLRFLVRMWILRRSRPDRNMAETYMAFNMLVRQLKRSYNED